MQRTWFYLMLNHHDEEEQQHSHRVLAHSFSFENTSFEFSNSWCFSPNGNWRSQKKRIDSNDISHEINYTVLAQPFE